MAYTNNLNVWANNSNNVESSTTLASSATEGKNANAGVAAGNPIYSDTFNGILKEVSLVTKSLIDSLISHCTDIPSSSVVIDNSESDITDIINNCLDNISLTNIYTNNIYPKTSGGTISIGKASIADLSVGGDISLLYDLSVGQNISVDRDVTIGGNLSVSTIGLANNQNRISIKNLSVCDEYDVKVNLLLPQDQDVTYNIYLPDSDGTLALISDVRSALKIIRGRGLVINTTFLNKCVRAEYTSGEYTYPLFWYYRITGQETFINFRYLNGENTFIDVTFNPSTAGNFEFWYYE